MTAQTMKRFIALKFQGIKVTNLTEYGTHSSGVTYVCTVTERMFHCAGPKEITEITPAKQEKAQVA
jgi:hypothetical protein